VLARCKHHHFGFVRRLLELRNNLVELAVRAAEVYYSRTPLEKEGGTVSPVASFKMDKRPWSIVPPTAMSWAEGRAETASDQARTGTAQKSCRLPGPVGDSSSAF